MRPLRFIFSLALLLISGTGAWAQSAQAAFERGEAAYQRKDYANALALWLPLAQQRHSLAKPGASFCRVRRGAQTFLVHIRDVVLRQAVPLLCQWQP